MFNHTESKSNPARNGEMATVVYLKPLWEQIKDRPGEINGNVLLFDTNSDLYDELVKNRGIDHCIIVYPGTDFREINENAFCIHPGNSRDYRKLYETLAGSKRFPGTLIHYWAKNEFDGSITGAEKQCSESIYPVFYMSRALMMQKARNTVKMVFLYKTKTGIHPIYEGITGFARTLSRENPGLQLKKIRIDDTIDTPGLKDIIEYESSLPSFHDQDVAYFDKERHVLHYNEVESHAFRPDFRPGNTILKDGGVYIITGGMGGLGYIITEYLAKRIKAAKLILTGRSLLTASMRARMRSLKLPGGCEVTYYPGDLSVADDVRSLFEKVKKKYSAIDGIIHCAGVVKDSFIMKKSREDFETVVKPKIMGTLNLYNACKGQTVDFLVLFSSISAVLGNLGQCDYSFANAFLDSFAHWIKTKSDSPFGKVLSINWPLWEEGGMKVDESALAYLENSFGMIPLSVENGLNAFGNSLCFEGPQFIVVEGFKERILKAFHHSYDTVPGATQDKPSGTSGDSDRKTLLKNIHEYLKHLFSEETKIPLDKLKADDEFEKYGLDSVMIMNLNAKLDKKIKNLSRTLLYEYNSLEDLALYFAGNHAADFVHTESDENDRTPRRMTSRVMDMVKRKQYDLSSVKFMSTYLNTDDAAADIAIIGVSGRYPQAGNLDILWNNLKGGKDSITIIPEERWNYLKYFNTDKGKEGTAYSKWGGFLDDYDKFDALFFNISPKEAEILDPQERIFLETVWHTLEDAGYTRKDLYGSMAGVFAGVMWGEYQLYGVDESVKIKPNNVFASIANKVSYFFNFHGPSIAIDSMCSSSLSAIHFACKSLLLGDCAIAVAGGVNLTLHPNKYLRLSQDNFLSTDGKCRAFGARGDGYVPGEGVGAVLLKPLKDAVNDNDKIYAVIKSTALNHGGKTSGYTVPNPNAQADVIVDALKKSKIEPETISYIECHGTGTILGDPIEITGLKKAFEKFTQAKDYCSIGSIKSNIGHLEAAAGIAALTKVLLQMKHKQLVPSLHSKELNPNIDLTATPFRVQQELQAWEPVVKEDGLEKRIPRRAGVSSFGAGGANAHIVLEEYEKKPVQKKQEGREYLFIFSARTEEQLREYAERFLDYLQSPLAEMHNTSPAPSHQSPGITDNIMHAISQILELEKTQLHIDDKLNELGFDLQKYSDLLFHINNSFNVKLALSFFDGFYTIKELCMSLEKEMKPVQSMNPGKNEWNPEDVAYMLQTGREPLSERFAVIASRSDEVEAKIRHFLDRENCEGLFSKNNVKSDDYACDSETIRKALEEKNYRTLGAAWVCGTGIDWKRMYGNTTPGKSDLPLYPFKRTRYWLPDNYERKAEKNDEFLNDSLTLHPLLKSNKSTLLEQKFETTFTGNEFFLKDHVIRGKNILPAAAYIEMARKAGEIAAEEKVYSLKNIIWAKPFVFNEKSKAICISIIPCDEGLDFEVWNNQGSEDAVFARGHIVPGEYSAYKKNIPWKDYDSITGANRIGKKEWYTMFASRGIVYGESFRGVEELAGNESEVFAVIKNPGCNKKNAGDYYLHPSLLDSIFQATAGCFVHSGDNALYIPFSIGEITFFKELPGKCLVYINMIQKNDQAQIMKFDSTVFNENKELVMVIKNFVLKSLFKAGQPEEKLLYFSPAWKERDIPATRSSDITGKQLLIFEDPGEWDFTALKRTFAKPPVCVRTGNSFACLDDLMYQVHPDNENDFIELTKHLLQKKQFPEFVIYGWSPGQHYHDTDIKIEEILSKTVFPLFFFTRACLSTELPHTIKIVYLSRLADGTIQPQDKGVSSFLKTVNKESTRFLGKTVYLGSGCIMGLDEIIYRELMEDSYDEMKYENKKSYVPCYLQQYPSETGNGLELKGEGVYIVTGGMGGIGFILSEFIASKYKPCLIVIGRSRLHPEIEEKIKILTDRGARVHYFQADISKFENVEIVIGKVKSLYGKIDGVIQSAGVVRDSLIINKTGKDVDAVLKPKITGTLHLDYHLRNEKLDFFIVFSSIASVFGNTGQAAYSCANGFLDAFIALRHSLSLQNKRSGISLSINWPLWKEGGMGVNHQKEVYLKEHYGMVPLKTENGISAFFHCLSSGKNQIIVFEGFEHKIKKILGIDEGKKRAATQLLPVKSEDVKNKLQNDVSKMISLLLKLPVEEIDPGNELGDYGFDSISFTALTNTINTTYAIQITPALFFEYPVLQSFIDYVYDNNSKEIRNYYSSSITLNQEQNDMTDESSLHSQQYNTSALKRRRVHHSTHHLHKNEDIAVIGIAGRMPRARNLDEFWKNLESGKDCITEVPGDRWDWREYYDEEGNAPDTSKSRWGGFMEDVYRFDAKFFTISPREAELMDPQHRLFLEIVWETIANAGYKPSDLSGTRTGLFVGVGGNDYFELLNKNNTGIQAYTSTGNMHSMLTNRISYLLDLHGPSEPIDTACSSSLVAIHRSVESLQNGECDMAIAGGVNVILTPTWHISFSKAGMLSKDGRCRTFDKKADGYVRGEGVGAVLLKPLSRAEEDGDFIYAVIKGSSVNHGGHANSLTAPNPNAQAMLLTDAFKRAHVDPKTISYIEAHGTGTPLGDPIEINALKKAFKEYESNVNQSTLNHYCGIGSVKTNIGHLETAAGIAGVLKVILALQNKKLPQTVHYHELNPYIELEQSPFYIVDKTREWKPLTDENGVEIKRCAGVSSFGFGGVNAHIIFEEYDNSPGNVPASSREKYPVLLSAKSGETLDEYVNSLYTCLENSNGSLSIDNVAYTLQSGREAFHERIVFLTENLAGLKEMLHRYQQGEKQISNVLQGNKIHQSFNLFEGEAGKDYINRLIQDQDVEKLSQLWLSGLDIDWSLLYPDNIEKPKRIPLPGSLFKGELYRIQSSNGSLNRAAGKLHPLIGKNSSTLNEQSFSSRFKGDEFFLRDHLVKDRKILPASVYLEMIHAAAELSLDTGRARITEVKWIEPFISYNEEKNVYTRLYPRKDRSVTLEISGDTKKGKNILATGTLVFRNHQTKKDEPERIQIQEIISGSKKEFNEKEIYHSFKNKGIVYGDTFRIIEKIYVVSGTEVLAKVDSSRLEDPHSYTYHPCLMDAAFQSVIGIAGLEGTELYLPYSSGEIVRFDHVRETCFIYVRQHHAGKPDFIQCTLLLLSGEGNVLCRVKDFVIKKIVPRDKTIQIKEEHSRKNTQPERDRQNNNDPEHPAAQFRPNNNFSRYLQEDLVKIISELQKYDINKINIKTDLSKYGFDSISFADLANRINKKYNIKITPSVFFENPYIEKVSARLIADFNTVFRDYYKNDETEGHLFPVRDPVSTNVENSPESEMDKEIPAEPVKEQEPQANALRFFSRQEHTTNIAEPIAIVGISGIYPDSPDMETYWENLVSGKELISEIPGERWNWEEYYGDPSIDNKIDTKWGGFIKDAKTFDTEFFTISPREAVMMDPQQRKLLEVVWHTIEDAGYRLIELCQSRVGVFIGVMNNDFLEVLKDNDIPIDSFYGTGYMNSFLANRISYLLDLHGPSEVVDTACSSSTVAIHRAVKALQHNECEVAIAGGVNLIFTPTVTIGSAKTGILTNEPHIKTFDKEAKGYLRGEGIGTVMLKTLSKAKEDGDNIHAVILSSAVSHGGKSNSLTTLNLNGQFEVITRAYESAGITPDSVNYIELQGPASYYGDPVEIDAVKKAFKYLLEKNNVLKPGEPYCGIGTLKPNIGHLESASGIAALTKVVLALRHKKIPGIINLETINPLIDLDGEPFYLVRETRTWEQMFDENKNPVPRRANINSYGIGGTNAHLIIEEYQENQNSTESEEGKEPYLFILSARDKNQLMEYVKRIIHYLNDTDTPLRNIEYTLQTGREEMKHRLAVCAPDKPGLIRKLEFFLQGSPDMLKQNVFSGTIDEDDLLLDEEIYEQAVNKACEQRDKVRLAKFWIKGIPVQWKKMYASHITKISLPGYPFKKEVHWINEADKNASGCEIKPDKKEGFIPVLSREDIQSSIAEIVNSYIATEMNTVDPGKELADYGIESRMIIQINFELERKFAIKIPTHTFFKNNSLQALTDFIYNRLQNAGTGEPLLDAVIVPPTGDKPEDIPGLINSFSSEEIDILYNQMKRNETEQPDYVLI